MYEGLPIATNKISFEHRRGIPHHLLGCVRLGENPWTVRQFHAAASKIIEDIKLRGKLPVLVGGTHYYLQSLLFPKSLIEDDDQAKPINEEEEDRRWPILAADTDTMFEELRRVDPEIAQRWHPRDRRKIRRSLQIWLQSGRRASELYQEQKQSSSRVGTELHGDSKDAENIQDSLKYDHLIFWTYSSQPILNQRLDDRVDSMVSDGLLEEVRSMHSFLQAQSQQGNVLDDSRGVWIAIGCKEMLPYITKPFPTDEEKEEGIRNTKIATRQYAKGQDRWIRLKLLHAVKEAGLERNMFLLDATDVAQLSSNVETAAGNLTSTFLAGDTLPEPASLSDVAKEKLAPEARETINAQYCEACDKTLMSDIQWLNHLKSKRHKYATKPKVDWKAMYPKKENR